MLAITRAVSPSLGRCELTHLARTPIDVARAEAQHAAYEAALRGVGVEVVRAAPALEMPDAVFVEDAAVVLEAGAIMTRPGATTRRGEVAGVAEVLRRYGEVQAITQGTLDGGDILRIGKTLYVGMTGRTDAEGAAALERLAGGWGYRVVRVEVRGCLHLKSAATLVAERVVLVNPAWVEATVFADMECVAVDAREAYGANGLLVEGHVIYPEHFPWTRERLERRGVRVVPVACDELAKAEGAVTCCSLLVPYAA